MTAFQYLGFATRRAWRLTLLNLHAPGRRCWICGALADSTEHRIKRSDMVRAYGRGPYAGDQAPAHVRNRVITLIQGPRAGRTKYAPSLCRRCNDTLTQPCDRAYDRFVDWITANEAQVLRRRTIDFQDIYGDEYPVAQLSLFRYFTKSFGCRLVDANMPVPQDLIAVLLLAPFRTALRITISVDERLRTFFGADATKFLGKGDLFGFVTQKPPHRITGYVWNEHVGWLIVNYWYGVAPEGVSGATWIANARHLYLGALEETEPS